MVSLVVGPRSCRNASSVDWYTSNHNSLAIRARARVSAWVRSRGGDGDGFLVLAGTELFYTDFAHGGLVIFVHVAQRQVLVDGEGVFAGMPTDKLNLSIGQAGFG